MQARMIAGAAVMMALAAASAESFGEAGPPRRDRHGRRQVVEPTEFTVPKKKSEKLARLLRK